MHPENGRYIIFSVQECTFMAIKVFVKQSCQRFTPDLFPRGFLKDVLDLIYVNSTVL